MEEINAFLGSNIFIIVVIISVLLIVSMVISIVSIIQLKKLKKRYETFTGGAQEADYTLEMQFEEYHKSAKAMEERYSKLAEMIRDIDKNMEKCVQKVGIVRYNPFDEVGGNLSYAVALLDKDDNGVVLNGIHSRTGSFSYAKPVEFGVSEYMLSVEESEALQKALDNGYTPKDRQEELNELEESLPKVYAVQRGKKRNNVEEEFNVEEILENSEELIGEDEDMKISEEVAAIISSIEKNALKTENSSVKTENVSVTAE